VLRQHRPGDLADVLAGVAVLGGRLAPRGGDQRVGEPIDLRAVPVDLTLLDHGAGHRSRGRGNEPDVQEPGARNLNALDGRIAGQLVGDRLRQDARWQARFPGRLEREIRGVVTVAGIPRPLDSGHRRQHGPIQVPVDQHGHGRGHDRVAKLGGSHTRMLEP
jgi:hypothetical protein